PAPPRLRRGEGHPEPGPGRGVPDRVGRPRRHAHLRPGRAGQGGDGNARGPACGRARVPGDGPGRPQRARRPLPPPPGGPPAGLPVKVVTAAALLQAGLTLDAVVPCPPRAVVGGKPFTNFEGEAPGPVPFLTDFARSCNTAFVGASSRLQPGGLAATAQRSFG